MHFKFPITKVLSPGKLFAFSLVLIFGLLLGYFRLSCFYEKHFFQTGINVLIYNSLRIAFVFYLVLLLYSAGALALSAVFGSDMMCNLSLLQNIVLAGIAGFAVIHIVAFPLGLLGWFTPNKAALLTSLVLLAGAGHCRNIFLSIYEELIKFWSSYSSKVIFTSVFMAVSIALLYGTLIVVKAVYPGSNHDYIMHYFPYYRTVIDSGTTMPNQVWYHFFYDKGQGLFFTAMLLTDLLGAQLATACTVFYSSLILFAIIRCLTPNSWWAVMLLSVFVVFYIFTPGPRFNMLQGGWGHFEKPHELVSFVVLALTWLYVTYRPNEPQLRTAWICVAAGLLISVILIQIVVSVFFAGFLSIIFCASLLPRFSGFTSIAVKTFLAMMISIITMLCINYLLTGIPSDLLVVSFWKYLDFVKVSEWGALLDIARVYHVRKHCMSAPVGIDTIALIWNCFRLDILWPLYVTCAFLLAIHLTFGKRTKQLSANEQVVALTVASCLISGTIFVVIGRGEPISLYRLTTFLFPISLLAVTVVLIMTCNLFKFKSTCCYNWTLLPIMLIIVMSLANMSSIINKNNYQMVYSSLKFLVGGYSLYDAYQSLNGWPGVLPCGAVHSASKAAYEMVGPRKRIWCFNEHHYCMLPNCNMQTQQSMLLTRDIFGVIYGSASQARNILSREGLDYFLITLEKRANSISDPLAYSQLFSVPEIKNHLEILWTDGKSYLLTWPKKGTTKLDNHWLEKYESMKINNYGLLNAYFDYLPKIVSR